MASKEFNYELVKVVSIIGEKKKRHQSIEIGHYVVDGEKKSDNVYVFDHYFNKDGELVKSSKCITSMPMYVYEAIKNSN